MRSEYALSDSTLEEMTGSAEILKRLDVSKIPFLKSLKVAAVKYIPENDDVVLKVQFPDGQYALAVTYMRIQGKDQNSTLLQRVSGSLLTAIPGERAPKSSMLCREAKSFEE